MNRQQRRAAGRSGGTAPLATDTPTATPEDAEEFIRRAITDRISWVAARTLLVRALGAPLDPELRAAVDHFLDGHPDPTPAPSAPPA